MTGRLVTLVPDQQHCAGPGLCWCDEIHNALCGLDLVSPWDMSIPRDEDTPAYGYDRSRRSWLSPGYEFDDRRD